MFLFNSLRVLWVIVITSLAVAVVILVLFSATFTLWLFEDEGYFPWMCLCLVGLLLILTLFRAALERTNKIDTSRQGVQL